MKGGRERTRESGATMKRGALHMSIFSKLTIFKIELEVEPSRHYQTWLTLSFRVIIQRIRLQRECQATPHTLILKQRQSVAPESPISRNAFKRSGKRHILAN